MSDAHDDGDDTDNVLGTSSVDFGNVSLTLLPFILHL